MKEATIVRTIWRLFSQLPDDAKRPLLRWMADRWTAEEASKKRAAAILFASPIQLVESPRAPTISTGG